MFDRPGDEALPDGHEYEWLEGDNGDVEDTPAWPASAPGDLEAATWAAEQFRAERRFPPAFSISAGVRSSGIGMLLAKREYRRAGAADVMLAELTEDRPVGRPVAITDAPSSAWLDAWWAVEARYSAELAFAREIMTGVGARYATAGPGMGRSVLQGEWLGVYCTAVPEPYRRQGIARDVLNALLNDGRSRGAARAYLCVTRRNTGARAFYESAGFEISTRPRRARG